MDFLTPEFFNTLIIINMIVGLLLAGFRFYKDMTRPLPPSRRSSRLTRPDDDTQPNAPVHPTNDI